MMKRRFPNFVAGSLDDRVRQDVESVLLKRKLYKILTYRISLECEKDLSSTLHLSIFFRKDISKGHQMTYMNLDKNGMYKNKRVKRFTHDTITDLLDCTNNKSQCRAQYCHSSNSASLY